MKGGFNNPPNQFRFADEPVGGCASMKGGFNNPPNITMMILGVRQDGASMKGGFNNPPNPSLFSPTLTCGFADICERLCNRSTLWYLFSCQ